MTAERSKAEAGIRPELLPDAVTPAVLTDQAVACADGLHYPA